MPNDIQDFLNGKLATGEWSATRDAKFQHQCNEERGLVDQTKREIIYHEMICPQSIQNQVQKKQREDEKKAADKPKSPQDRIREALEELSGTNL